jgi:isopenicillin N synthase-like dioxygenase
LNLSEERFSIPYFVAANYDTLIEPFPQLIGTGQPARYEPFLAGAHLERMLVRDFPYLRKYQGHSGGASTDHAVSVTQNSFELRINPTRT